MAETYNDKMKRLLRKANPQCNQFDCKLGTFHKSEATYGNVICTGCVVKGKNFGVLMIMPENFEMPPDSVCRSDCQ